MKFQALGSNYSFRQAVRQLFTIGSSKDSKQLVKLLERRYGGRAYLYSKGRNALSEAVRLSVEDGSSLVAVNGLTCSVVIDAIEDLQAEPLYLDVNPTTAHFDSAELESALAAHDGISAVIVQNTYGRMCDITKIETLAREHNVVLIEDLAHSVGQTYPDGREAGTVGDVVMLSFGRDKLLDVVNGGALIIRSPQLRTAVQPASNKVSPLSQLRDRMYPLLTWKVRRMYEIGVGKIILRLMYSLQFATRSADGGIHRSKMLPHWQAKLALRKLGELDKLNEHRRELMIEYQRYFGDELISADGTIRAALRVTDRSRVLELLRENGYELRDTWYDTPIGPARKYKHIAYPESLCPNAVELSRTIINLPTHAEISNDDVARISQIVRQNV